MSSTGVRDAQRYWNIAGRDFIINAKEEAYVFIREKNEDFAKKTVTIFWISKKCKNLFFSRDLKC